MEYLVAENVSKHYARHTALDHVSISVPKGHIYGLLGPNGAGKTTLIRIINQINYQDEGVIHFNGEKLKKKHIYEIGYLPEERGLYKKMKVGEQALYLAQLKGMKKREALEALKKWFIKFGIQDWWDRKVEELSKGMQQKVQFIVTIIHRPGLLIFDEPFSGFDPVNANLLKQEILKMKEEGSTIIFSTHNMASVEEVCDKITLINKSRKMLEGPIDEIKSEYKSNVFEVGLRSGDDQLKQKLSAEFHLLDFWANSDHYMAKLQLNSDGETNAMLEKMLRYGNIVSFNEVVPNMNDIFIRVVEEKHAG